MDVAYKIMFISGILYTFVSLLISGISGALHLGSHLGHIEGHIGGHGHMHGHAGHGHVGGHSDAHMHHGHTGDVGTQEGLGHTFISWISILINPIVVVSFFTVFGGLGILGTEYFKWVAVKVLIIALSSGIIVAFLLYRFVAIPLYNSENSTDVPKEDLVGTQGEVTSKILENGFGKIQYTVNSIRYTAPAMHTEGKEVDQGMKVIIVRIENNVFYIAEMEVV